MTNIIIIIEQIRHIRLLRNMSPPTQYIRRCERESHQLALSDGIIYSCVVPRFAICLVFSRLFLQLITRTDCPVGLLTTWNREFHQKLTFIPLARQEIPHYATHLMFAVAFKYNQQDATLYSIIYYCQCSTCFRRFLRPSSGTQKLYTQHWVYATHASGSSKQAWHIPDAMCTVFELLMMGGETV